MKGLVGINTVVVQLLFVDLHGKEPIRGCGRGEKRFKHLPVLGEGRAVKGSFQH